MRLSKLLFQFSLRAILIVSIAGVLSCKSSENSNDQTDNCLTGKIKFDLSDIDKRGLTGDVNNKSGIDFEFCVPNQPEIIEKVLSIDGSLKKQASKGRSNCSEKSVLITGNTYNKDARKLLCKIAELEYVKEINQTYWE